MHVVLEDGKIRKENTYDFTRSDRFEYGEAVFETLRNYEKSLFKLREHIERLFRSAEIMGIDPLFTQDQIESAAKDVLASSEYERNRMRIILTPKELVIECAELLENPDPFYTHGVTLTSYKGQREFPEAKVLGDKVSADANAFAKQEKFYDAILVDEGGNVLEAAYANIFWVKDGVIYTTKNKALHGVTQQTVIDLFPDTELTNISLEDLKQADEVFITQTSGGPIPVKQIEDTQIGEGKAGPVSKKVVSKFNEFAYGG